MAKIQPAVKTIFLKLPGNTPTPGAGVATTQYFGDISQMACILNRRFYRQGLSWVVAGFKVHVASGYHGSVGICRLPDSWPVSNGWHKAYAHWKSQQDDAMREAGVQSSIAKYRDFKIHMDTDHVTATFANNLIPIDCDGEEFALGEWDASQIVVPNVIADASGSLVDPYEYLLHMVGANANAASTSRGIVDGYANSRAYPQSPDPASPPVENSDNWFQQMDDVGNDNPEIILNASGRNDDLPYDQVDYPGGEHNAPGLQFVDNGSVIATSVSRSVLLRGDTFPCGLFTVGIGTAESSNPNSSDVYLSVYLVPGSSRGYLTQPMQDM
jgi:hypothetical protein